MVDLNGLYLNTLLTKIFWIFQRVLTRFQLDDGKYPRWHCWIFNNPENFPLDKGWF